MYFPQESKVIGVTGHRPQSIDSHFDYKTPIWLEIYEWYEKLFDAEQPDFVLSGMALGVDTMAAKAAVSVGIPLVACVPFSGQERKWVGKAKVRYNWLITRAEEIVYTDRYYEIVDKSNYYWKLEMRNRFMVDNSTFMAATWNGIESGGTWNCIKYAESNDVPVLYNRIKCNGSQGIYK